MGVLTLQFTKDALQGKPVKIKLLSMDQVSSVVGWVQSRGQSRLILVCVEFSGVDRYQLNLPRARSVPYNRPILLPTYVESDSPITCTAARPITALLSDALPGGAICRPRSRAGVHADDATHIVFFKPQLPLTMANLGNRPSSVSRMCVVILPASR